MHDTCTFSQIAINEKIEGMFYSVELFSCKDGFHFSETLYMKKHCYILKSLCVVITLVYGRPTNNSSIPLPQLISQSTKAEKKQIIS